MKTLKKRHWLEIAEYITLIGSLVTLIFAIFTKLWIFSLFFLFLSLVINLLNRWRLEASQRKRLSSLGKQLQQQFSQEIQSLHSPQAVSSLSSSSRQLNASELSIITDSLSSIEQSITNIVQYLNTHALLERIERLELLSNQLQEELSKIIGKELKKTDLTANSPNYSIPLTPNLSSIPSWQLQDTFQAHEGAVSCLEIFIQDHPYLVSGSWDQRVKLWDLSTGELKMSVKAHSQGIISLSVIQREGELILATGSFDQTIHLWLIKDISSNKPELSLIKKITSHTGSIHDLVMLEDVLISGSYDQTVKQWNLVTEEMITSSLDHSGAIYAVAVSKNQQMIASAGGDGRISLWQLKTGKLVSYLTGNLSSVESLKFSPDGSRLAAGCVDGRIKIWSINLDKVGLSAPIQPIKQFIAHQGQIKGLYFSKNGELLYSVGTDGYLHIWHFNSYKSLKTLRMNEIQANAQDSIISLILSPDQTYLVTGNTKGEISYWC